LTVGQNVDAAVTIQWVHVDSS